jgi:hypothetical protein
MDEQMSPYHHDFLYSEAAGVIAVRKALADLNSVQLTIEQIEQGAEVFQRAAYNPNGFDQMKNSMEVDARGMVALLAWCEEQGLLPAEAAAWSIRYHDGRLSSFYENGLRNPKEQCPEAYVEALQSPLTGWTFVSTNTDPRYADFQRHGLLPD